ncbi:M10 family metallopeptidase C-terminal domain-containing protein [Colwellia sp. 6M3]|uniref:M10 family metallopeptidase C-terminal domain-containing protein n=1 Tax=Colwellia sp. 6M3 TaxID=2759849 RepID=UPI0015F7843B|nr:M10 family metallopeptidase C-terminal domain-containing protein [Colwellia sp. 6M3]MBA6416810.1 M10 family metallopeptidase C-terminal domain-containing protein [Colwellia sp. 6M3]
MYKKVMRSALCISLMATSAFATMATADVVQDFTQVHYFGNEVETQYITDALAPYGLSRWNNASPLGTPVTVYYAFAGDTLGYISPNDVQRSFHQYEKDVIVEILNDVMSFTNITLIETTDISITNFVFRISPTVGNGASLPPQTPDDTGYKAVSLSDVDNLPYLNPDRENNYVRYKHYDVDYKHDVSRSKWFISHEIGHVLGLFHPFNVIGGNSAPFPLDEEDNHQFNTVMSYQSGNLSSEGYSASNFRIYDIIALQSLYGVNTDNKLENTLYEYDDNYDFHQVIADTGGEDTISVENSARDNVIDLRGGKFSSIAPNFVSWYTDCYDGSYEGDFTTNPDGTCTEDTPTGGHEHLNRSHNSLSIDINTVIENATGGTGDDTLVANSVANDINGGDGTDTVMFAGAKSDYTIDFINAYTVVVTSVADTDDEDTLTNVEFLSFVTDFSDLSTAEVVNLNQAPVVTLAETITVRETLQTTITATAVDAENDALTYTWTQLDGTDVTLTNADTLSVTLTAPSVDAQETITLQLEVTDGVNTVTSSISVVVIPNTVPVITDVTADQTVDERTAVTLTVTATDADNDALTYRWTVDGATVTLTGDNSDTVTFTAPSVTGTTTLTVTVFVSDGIDEVSETRTITVNNIDTTPDPAVTPSKKESSGGSFGYLILLIAGLRLFRK